MKTHWTERSIKDYLFRIGADFIAQLEKKMELHNTTQDRLAESLGITKGRVSQIINYPGNITLANIIKFARTLGMKVSIVAYEDDDPENKRGPINSEVFKICWEKFGKPVDFWAFQEIGKNEITSANTADSVSYIGQKHIMFLPPLSLMPGRISCKITPSERLCTASTQSGKMQYRDAIVLQ